MIFGKRTRPLVVNKATNLAEWLEIATRNLLPQTQARIRVEIETHYADSVQSNKTIGMNEVEAHAAALANLGDAEASRVRFCREYLSTLDTNFVNLQAVLQIVLGIFWTSGLISLDVMPDPNAAPGPLGVLLILFSFFVVFPTVFLSVRAIVRRWPLAVTQRLVFMLLTADLLNMCAYIVMKIIYRGSSSHFRLSDFPNAFIFIVMYGWTGLLLFRLRKKLIAAGEEGIDLDEPPAPKPQEAQ